MKLKALSYALIAGLGLTATMTSNVMAAWRTGASVPIAVQEIYTDTMDGKIYVAGGFVDSSNTFTDQFSVYDAVQDKWNILASLPEKRHHITLSSLNGKIYGVGGFFGKLPQWEARSSMYIYNPESNRWTNGVDLPSPRGEHVSAVVDGKIYIIGGRTGGPDTKHIDDYVETTRNEVFDPKTDKWSRLADAPTPRNSAAAVVIDGKIYVVGGRQNQHDPEGKLRLNNLKTLEVYDPTTDQWEVKAAMPIAQAGLAAATLGGKLYIFGGEQSFPEDFVYKRVWVYDPKTDQWGETDAMPTPRHGLAAATVDSEIFVFGGSIKPGLGAVNTNEVYKP